MKNFTLFSVSFVILASSISSSFADVSMSDESQACENAFNTWYGGKYADAIAKLGPPPFGMNAAQAAQRQKQAGDSVVVENTIREAGLKLCSLLN